MQARVASSLAEPVTEPRRHAIRMLADSPGAALDKAQVLATILDEIPPGDAKTLLVSLLAALIEGPT